MPAGLSRAAGMTYASTHDRRPFAFSPGNIRPPSVGANALQWREIEGEIVALDGETSQYVAANASAALLWHKLAEGTTRDELVEALVEAFGMNRERAATDIDAFLWRISARSGCLEREPQAHRRAHGARCALGAQGSAAHQAAAAAAQPRGGSRSAAPPASRSRSTGRRDRPRRQRPSCLERSLVLQRWLASQGTSRDLVIGVTGPGPQLPGARLARGRGAGRAVPRAPARPLCRAWMSGRAGPRPRTPRTPRDCLGGACGSPTGNFGKPARGSGWDPARRARRRDPPGPRTAAVLCELLRRP